MRPGQTVRRVGKTMSAHYLYSFLPPALLKEQKESGEMVWPEGRSWARSPKARSEKRHYLVAEWAVEKRAEVPIIERVST